MAGFVQIIEWSSSRIDEVRRLATEFRSDDEVREDGPLRITVTSDRGVPDRFMTIVEFASYEGAMRNSEAPGTQEFARRMSELCDGPPVFHDLDVIESVTPGSVPA